MKTKIDIKEQSILDKSEELLNILLLDRTTGKNIIWGSEDYEHLGSSYKSYLPITVNLITGVNTNLIQPRVKKHKKKQGSRTKGKAEVFTPSWLCNAQNNLIDSAWFGRSNVFNIEKDKGWETNTKIIEFSSNKNRTWQKYVDDIRMEVTCGEAPYLVSRYDSTTGQIITLKDRIGLLDRKLRVVGENVNSENEWLKWAERAFQSIYGFEFHGDSLLLARENLLCSYIDYMEDYLGRAPKNNELLKIARIISWNIWQMDGLTLTIPYKNIKRQYVQKNFFENESLSSSSCYCRIKDWRSKKIIEYRKLINRGGNSV